MRPVFERLVELEIPKEAAMLDEGVDDMSLIYELENLMDCNFNIYGSDAIDATDLLVSEETDVQVGMQFMQTENDLKSYLLRNGGRILLEEILRERAKNQGFQRLGRNVRQQLFDQLKSEIKDGIIKISGDFIELC